MEVEIWPIDKPIPYAMNPRNNAKAITKVAASIREFGFRQPIVVDRSGTVVVGHTRLEAAKRLGLQQVPVHRALDLSPAQARAYRLMDNRAHEDAAWDGELLKLELGELETADFDLSLSGFTDSELRQLLANPDGTSGGSEPAIPEPPLHPITTRGDVWELGPHRLLCGDSTVLADVRKLSEPGTADVVFTDPPYAIYGSSTGVASDISDDKMIRPFFRDVIAACVSALRPFGHAYICCDWRSWSSWWEMARGTGLTPKNMIVWDKGAAGLGGMYANTHELLLFASMRPLRKAMTQKIEGERQVHASNIWRFDRVRGQEREHNAQKPVPMIERAFELSSDNGATVVDFFAGSGSSLIAAQNTGRVARLMEIDERYCDVTIRRWQNHTGAEATRDGQRYSELCDKRDAAVA